MTICIIRIDNQWIVQLISGRCGQGPQSVAIGYIDNFSRISGQLEFIQNSDDLILPVKLFGSFYHHTKNRPPPTAH